MEKHLTERWQSPVECARLEIVFTGNSNKSSNLFLSATCKSSEHLYRRLAFFIVLKLLVVNIIALP